MLRRVHGSASAIAIARGPSSPGRLSIRFLSGQPELSIWDARARKGGYRTMTKKLDLVIPPPKAMTLDFGSGFRAVSEAGPPWYVLNLRNVTHQTDGSTTFYNALLQELHLELGPNKGKPESGVDPNRFRQSPRDFKQLHVEWHGDDIISITGVPDPFGGTGNIDPSSDFPSGSDPTQPNMSNPSSAAKWVTLATYEVSGRIIPGGSP